MWNIARVNIMIMSDVVGIPIRWYLHVVSAQAQEMTGIRTHIYELEKLHSRIKQELFLRRWTNGRQDAEIARLRREKAELEGKTSPSVSSRQHPPAIGLGSGTLFPALTPGVRENKPIPGTSSHDPYLNGGGYDGSVKRSRPDDLYSGSRGIYPSPTR
jgi:hypothetical protein